MIHLRLFSDPALLAQVDQIVAFVPALSAGSVLLR